MRVEKKVIKKCYVCGFTLKDYPYDPIHLIPNHSEICPACGIHYGYDDQGGGDVIPDELAYSDWEYGDDTHVRIIKFWRKQWIDKGMRWWSKEPRPKTWNPEVLIKNVPNDFK